MAFTDPYKVLGVSPDASAEEVKRAYRALAKKYHPDRHSDPVAKELAEQKMAEINQAYEMIESGEASRAFGRGQYNNPFGTDQEGRPHNPWEHQQSWYNRRTYQQRSPQGRMGGDSCCDQLCCFCMADSCCECMGGDLIPCM